MKKCLKGVFLCLVFLCLIGCERKVKLEFYNDETETYWEKDGIIYVYHHDEEMVTGYENYIIYPSYEKAKEATLELTLASSFLSLVLISFLFHIYYYLILL